MRIRSVSNDFEASDDAVRTVSAFGPIHDAVGGDRIDRGEPPYAAATNSASTGLIPVAVRFDDATTTGYD